MKKPTLADVTRVLRLGGCVRFHRRTGSSLLITRSGEELPLDNRTYRAMIDKPGFVKTETSGDGDNSDDFVVEWRLKHLKS